MPANPFNENLDKNAANYQPLTPLQFLQRAAKVYPQHTAIIHGKQRFTYAEFYARCRRLATALAGRGIGRGDTVAAMLGNTPEMYECHFGVPMAGAMLNALNTRLDSAAIAFMLGHGEAKAVIVDREFSGTIAEAISKLEKRPIVIDVDDPAYVGRYAGDVPHRDGSYHQGPAWPWLIGPYADAVLAVRGDSPETRQQLDAVIAPLLGHLERDGCLGSVSELFDGDAPHPPNGAVAQAWSVAELLRVYARLAERPVGMLASAGAPAPV